MEEDQWALSNETYNNTELDDYYYDPDDSFLHFDLWELIPTTVVYGLTLLIGILGNILIIITIAQYTRMRSITNVFLASLASADLLLILICVPVKFAKVFSYTWTQGEFLCKFVHYMQNVSAICSVLTLTSMSLERYYAILHPMRARYICTISQARKVIIGIWIVSFILAIPILFVQILYEVGHRFKGFWCIMDYENQRQFCQIYDVYMFVLILIIPTTVMVFAYSSICCEVWYVMQQRVTMTGGEMRNGAEREIYPLNSMTANGPKKEKCLSFKSSIKRPEDENNTVKQVIKMLAAVVILFMMCWTPLLVNNLLTAFYILEPLNYGHLKYMRIAFHLLAYFNSCVNPIVYGFMSRNFRESFMDALCMCRHGRRYRPRSFTQTRTTSVNLGRSMSVSTTAC